MRKKSEALKAERDNPFGLPEEQFCPKCDAFTSCLVALLKDIGDPNHAEYWRCNVCGETWRRKN